MKKLLIIQTDTAYFLLETLSVICRYADAFNAFEVRVLVDQEAYNRIKNKKFGAISGIIFDSQDALKTKYDMSINLSMNEASWDLHGKINSVNKSGPAIVNGEIRVPDMWSSLLLTLKSNSPFITFHLQDLYKNILGIKKVLVQEQPHPTIKTIVFGLTSHKLFTPSEQEVFLNGMTRRFRNLVIKDIAEVTSQESEHILYIGPACLDALILNPAKSILISANFQGFNLIPNREDTYLITTHDLEIKAGELLDLVEKIYHQQPLPASPYQTYRVDKSQLATAYLEALNGGDNHYPFYQAYVVLWNFLISLNEVNLPLRKLSKAQFDLVELQLAVINKLIRLHDYSLVSLDTVLRESKSNKADAGVIDGHLKNLREIDTTFESISQSHSLLRPLLDFYRVRRGQNDGTSLLDQVQNSILVYHEEHQALKAMNELLVGLKSKQ